MGRYPTGALFLLPLSGPRRAIHTCQNPRSCPPHAERILVIRLGAVGDVVRTLPAASALRAGYPSACLTWLVEPASADLLLGQPWIDEVLVFPRDLLAAALARGNLSRAARQAAGFVQRMRDKRFDLVVDFHAILKSAVLGWLCGAPRRVSYATPVAREGATLFATDRAKLVPGRRSRFERNLALVRYLGVGSQSAHCPLAIPPERLGAMDRALGCGPAPVVFHPGTSDATPHKRWNAGGYAAVARSLAAEDGTRVLVTSGPAQDDRSFAEAVVRASAGAARLAPPTPSLLDLAALFARSRLYVGSDTGPMHVASLVGTPVLQLLGPTDPVENAPWSATPSRTVRIQIACNPCRRGCDAAACMRAISPEQVLDAARELTAALPERG